jgi:uncharacterized membrane protein (UPF0127 family)
MTRAILVALALLICTACGAASTGAPAAQPDTLPITIRGARLVAEVVADPATRERGLMFRRDLPAGTGMLFVFPAEQPQGFWMRNTYVPLSIAYLDRDGRILNIADMQPLDESTHPSAGPAQFALEVPQGWFAEHQITPGDRAAVRLPPDLVIR